MSLMMNRDGSISLFRVGLIVGAFGIALGLGGFVLVAIDQASRQSPFFVERYPGASEWFTEVTGNTAQRVVYRVPETSPEEVAAFYQRKLDEHYNNSPNDPRREQCIRVPARGEFPDYAEGTGNVPYFFRCVFDNSTYGANQFTTVTIQPGVRNDFEDPPTDNTGTTIVEYEQLWSG